MEGARTWGEVFNGFPLCLRHLFRQGSLSIRKTNWENVGVEPDIKVPVGKALIQAHVLALRRLLERERDPNWKGDLRRAIEDVSAGKAGPY